MMKKFRTILCAVLAAGTLTACTAEATAFGTEVTDEGKGLTLTAENAGKGTAAGTEIDIAEGEQVTVNADVTSGAVRLTLTGEGKSEPSVDAVYDAAGLEETYELEPGTYMIMYTAEENKTTGTVRTAAAASETAEAPAEETSAAEDGQNPIMNFIGTYAKDRAMIDVSAADDKDGAAFHITWGTSAAEHSEWDMSGTFDPETLTVSYDNCTRKNIVFKEDGSVESEDIVYENGKGSFTFSADDATLTWNDEQEHQADDMVFGWALVD